MQFKPIVVGNNNPFRKVFTHGKCKIEIKKVFLWWDTISLNFIWSFYSYLSIIHEKFVFHFLKQTRCTLRCHNVPKPLTTPLRFCTFIRKGTICLCKSKARKTAKYQSFQFLLFAILCTESLLFGSHTLDPHLLLCRQAYRDLWYPRNVFLKLFYGTPSLLHSMQN